MMCDGMFYFQLRITTQAFQAGYISLQSDDSFVRIPDHNEFKESNFTDDIQVLQC